MLYNIKDFWISEEGRYHLVPFLVLLCTHSISFHLDHSLNCSWQSHQKLPCCQIWAMPQSSTCSIHLQSCTNFSQNLFPPSRDFLHLAPRRLFFLTSLPFSLLILGKISLLALLYPTNLKTSECPRAPSLISSLFISSLVILPHLIGVKSLIVDNSQMSTSL